MAADYHAILRRVDISHDLVDSDFLNQFVVGILIAINGDVLGVRFEGGNSEVDDVHEACRTVICGSRRDSGHYRVRPRLGGRFGWRGWDWRGMRFQGVIFGISRRCVHVVLCLLLRD